MNDSGINWRLVAYTVGGCWLIPAAMLLLGKQLFLFLNPFPIVVEAIIGILVYGYVGGMGGRNFEAIVIYWTLVGLGLSWLFHKSRSRASIITFIAMLHLILLGLSLFPMMLLNGR